MVTCVPMIDRTSKFFFFLIICNSNDMIIISDVNLSYDVGKKNFECYITAPIWSSWQWIF